MHAFREKDYIVLRFGRNESSLLQRILRNIRQQYAKHPSELDKRTGDAWFSTRGCLSAGLSAEETMEWIEQLHHFRSSHLAFITKTLEALVRRNPEEESIVHLSFEEAPVFLSVLNDHRLLAATQHAIGQEELEMDFFQALRKLPPAQQMALCEIELLARIMETVLHLLPNSGADWRKHVADDDDIFG